MDNDNKYKLMYLPLIMSESLEKALLRALISLKNEFINTSDIIEQKRITGTEYILLNFLNDLKNTRIKEEQKQPDECNNSIEEENTKDEHTEST